MSGILRLGLWTRAPSPALPCRTSSCLASEYSAEDASGQQLSSHSAHAAVRADAGEDAVRAREPGSGGRRLTSRSSTNRGNG